MMIQDLHLRAQTTMDVPWDRARERRVLARALATRRRRTRLRWTLELTAAMAITFVAGRALPRAPVESGEARPALAPPAAELDSASRSEREVKQTESPPLGGFAGTGGHGGTGSTGHGGSAGTG
jgi:hypothetical protein